MPRFNGFTVITLMLFAAGCDKGSSGAGESEGKNPSSAEVPKDPEKIAKLLERGGEGWSAPARLRGKDEYDSWAAGERFWVWPADDGPYVMKDGYVRLKLHWRVRPGQKSPEPGSDKEIDKAILGQFRLLPDHKFVIKPSQPGFKAVGGGQHAKLEVGAEFGTFTYQYDARSWQAKGEGWIVFYLASRCKTPKEGIAALDPYEPSSNLLKLKLKFDPEETK